MIDMIQSPECGAVEILAQRIERAWGEIPFASGTVADAHALIYVNPSTGSFSVIIATVNGYGCITISGENFNMVPRRPKTREG